MQQPRRNCAGVAPVMDRRFFKANARMMALLYRWLEPSQQSLPQLQPIMVGVEAGAASPPLSAHIVTLRRQCSDYSKQQSWFMLAALLRCHDKWLNQSYNSL